MSWTQKNVLNTSTWTQSHIPFKTWIQVALGTLFGEYLYKYCLYKEIINLAGSMTTQLRISHGVTANSLYLSFSPCKATNITNLYRPMQWAYIPYMAQRSYRYTLFFISQLRDLACIIIELSSALLRNSIAQKLQTLRLCREQCFWTARKWSTTKVLHCAKYNRVVERSAS